MTLKAAKRGAISPFIVMDVMRAANAREAQGDDILHMEVGQPSTAAPSKVLQAARDALDQELLDRKSVGEGESVGLGARRIERTNRTGAKYEQI